MNTYSINLLLENKKCLIVGGGKVAARKLKKLAEAKAQILLVAPKVNESINDLNIQYQNITILKQEYCDDHLNGIYLAFLPSDDRSLNKMIMKQCKKLNILTCAVDANWTDSDFITPASFVKDEINIAISSNGKTCRKTRMIRESLSRHIEMLNSGELIVLGTDHNFLNIDNREHLHLIGDKLFKVADMLKHVWGIHEFMILNTCNRIEVIAIICHNKDIESLMKMILGFNSLSKNDYYLKLGMEAFEHLAFSTAGLMSQTLGEKYITSQIKEALILSKKHNWSGAMLQNWIDSTLHLSKHIRHLVDPLFQHIEIEELAIKYADTTVLLKNKTILVIGTGNIGKAVIEKLIKNDVSIFWCYHKNIPVLSKEYNTKVKIINFNEIRENLSNIDILISATSANQVIIHKGHSPFFDTFREILMIDLAIPRNISPELSDVMENINIIDLDDLKHWHRRENCNMSEVYAISSKIVDEHKNMYDNLIYSIQGNNKTKPL